MSGREYEPAYAGNTETAARCRSRAPRSRQAMLQFDACSVDTGGDVEPLLACPLLSGMHIEELPIIGPVKAVAAVVLVALC